MSKIVGHISQVIGPVVDVRFKFDGVDAEHALPKIHDAMTIKRHDGRILVVEVQYRRVAARNGSHAYRTGYYNACWSSN